MSDQRPGTPPEPPPSQMEVAPAVVDAPPPSVTGSAAQLRRGFMTAFGLTWLAYASYYLCRKGFGVAKVSIVEDIGLSEGWLVAIDTSLLAAYAVGQFISGRLGDRLGARRLIGAGMLASAVVCFCFGLSSTAVLFVVFFGLNGLAQSTGWPGTVKAMAEWTTPRTRGRVMGVWATCYQFGGIAATAVATFFLATYGWRAAFRYPSIWVAAVGALVLLFLRRGPGAVGPERVPEAGDQDDAELAASAAADEALASREAQRQLVRRPTVWLYGSSYFCLKLIRYSFLFWLPYYFFHGLKLDQTTSGYLSTSFEIGGVGGTLLMGVVSDWLIKRIPRSACVAAAMVGLAGALFLYQQVGASSLALNFAAMALVGALLFAADSLLSGAAAQDAGGPRAAALAAGIVNGVGSIGAILAGTVTVAVKNTLGWDALFTVFLVLTLFGAAALIPTFRGSTATQPAAAS